MKRYSMNYPIAFDFEVHQIVRKFTKRLIIC